MFNLMPEQVVVVTDTLAMNTEHQPYLLVSKCAVVPHLNTVIAGTGAGQLGSRWVQFVSERMACLDVDMLDAHAPLGISRLWDELQAEHGGFEGTSTIYHFGRSEDEQRYVGYAYRSTNGFASESLGYGFGVKPPPEGGFDPSLDVRSLEEWIKLAVQIRGEEDLKPLPDRIHIGGALVCVMLQGGTITVSEIFRFDDFGAMWSELNTRL